MTLNDPVRRLARAASGLCRAKRGTAKAGSVLPVALLASLLCGPAPGQDYFSTTEMQFQFGKLDAPSFAGGGSHTTQVYTLQHASNWKYGDNFFFVDFLIDDQEDGFNDNDIYAELYPNLSLGKVLGRRIGAGPITDVGLLFGTNYGADPDVLKYLPGGRLSWSVPGFIFLNTDILAYLDDSRGVGGGGAPSENDSFMIDVNWARPFSFGDHDFSIEGHIEYIGQRRNEFGAPVKWWILGQPQFRYDLGKTLFGSPRRLFVGIEFQFWINKLGDDETDEVAVQALLVWRFGG